LRYRTGFLLHWLLLCLLPTPAEAQDEVTAAGDFFDEQPLILTVSRMSKPLLESPASVTVIDRQMIEASGVRELADLFRLVPGFVVGYHSGHAPVVTYQGLGQEFGRQMQVLIDGRSVFIPSFGGVPWSNLPLLIEDIERIEVIRGPNAVTYGANAFLATINIITRHAAEDRGARVSATASDNANPDIADAYLRIGSQLKDIDWRLSLGTLSDDGFAAINDSKQIAKINFRMDFASRRNQFWTLQAGSSDSTVGRGFPQTDGSNTDTERDEKASNSYVNLQWEGDWQSSSTLVRLTHTRQGVEDNYDPGPLTFGPVTGITTYIDFDRTSERSELELIQNNEIGEQLRLVYGGGLRQDRVRSVFLFNQDDFREVDTQRLFGSVEWRITSDWLLDLGIMFEDTSLTSTEDSPRIALIRKFGERHALRLVASEARRNPILYEHDGETEFAAQVPGFGTFILPTWTGNNALEAEKIDSYEIGLRSQLANGFESDIKLFTYEISRSIEGTSIPVNTGGPPPFDVVNVESVLNHGETEVDGVELGVSYKPNLRLRIDTGLSLVDAKSTNDDFEDSFPNKTAFFAARYRLDDRNELSGAFYYVDELSWTDSAAVIPIARRLDLRYAYRLANQFSIELIGQNLLGEYEDYEPENLHEPLAYVRLSGSF